MTVSWSRGAVVCTCGGDTLSHLVRRRSREVCLRRRSKLDNYSGSVPSSSKDDVGAEEQWSYRAPYKWSAGE